MKGSGFWLLDFRKMSPKTWESEQIVVFSTEYTTEIVQVFVNCFSAYWKKYAGKYCFTSEMAP
jgi:hypothetical protein